MEFSVLSKLIFFGVNLQYAHLNPEDFVDFFPKKVEKNFEISLINCSKDG